MTSYKINEFEVLGTEEQLNSLCPCKNINRTYKDCCALFHSGIFYPLTPEKLMRSRYSAFAIKNLGVYLKKTWHYSTFNSSIEELNDNPYEWINLQIGKVFKLNDREAYVEYKASYKFENKIHYLIEKSFFKKENNTWFYVDGIFLKEYEFNQKINLKKKFNKLSRNDLCPCKSGMKFKYCCMNSV